ncbi:MAG: L-serine ammonia-lyase, iron-sulfur-dependent, subunit beta [Clostridiales bacterium]|nr:L-serine ammonia-lyase, iron-sulfur-dependent, subunit beta [Clostridiales bacterium]
MDIFDILGPIMVGPSSSHTAGAARIGKITRMILKSPLVSADIYFHGSFADTYSGHGSDRAVVGGLLGFDPDDDRIRDSLIIAAQQGFKYSINTIELTDAHPNTILIEARSAGGGKIRLQGASVGGGNIVIQMIDDIKVYFNGDYDTLIVHHQDQPGVIGLVSSFLGDMQINIAGMRDFRDTRGGLAIMVIETDGVLPDQIDKAIEGLPHILKVIEISKL